MFLVRRILARYFNGNRLEAVTKMANQAIMLMESGLRPVIPPRDRTFQNRNLNFSSFLPDFVHGSFDICFGEAMHEFTSLGCSLAVLRLINVNLPAAQRACPYHRTTA